MVGAEMPSLSPPSHSLAIPSSDYPFFPMEALLTDLNATLNRHKNNAEIALFVRGLEAIISESPDDLINEYLDFDSDGSNSESASDSDNGETSIQSPNRNPRQQKYPIETQQKIAQLLDDGISYKQIKHRYKKIKSDMEITRIREYVANGGSKYQKLSVIERHVLETFTEARRRNEPMHDLDIATLGLLKAREIGFPEFKASPTWIMQFKRRHKIVGRRVTKIVPTTFNADEEVINQRARDFLHTTIGTLIRENIPQTMVLGFQPMPFIPFLKLVNGDHTGVCLEMPTFRTLESMGSKDVLVAHQKMRSVTHSFTLFPVISCSGQLFKTFLVCFYEPNRPQKFEDDLAEFDRLFCLSSPSGKMSADLQLNWFKEHFVPNSPRGVYFLLDSWTGFKRSLNDDVVSDHLNFLVLPEKTTSRCQPLDRLWNRQFKLFLRTMHEKIRRCFPDFNISKRKNIGCLLNEIHYQFSAPIFVNFIRYSWKMSGFLGIVEIPSFETPPQYCFRNLDVSVSCKNCDSPPFIRCAWCSHNFCFQHFILTIHRCD